MTVRQLVLAGDSLVQGTEGNSETAKLGLGSWAEIVAEELANIPSVGPLLSPGLRGCWQIFVGGDGSGEWTKSGTWTQTVSTDAFDKAPHGFAFRASGGITNSITWTKPSRWRPIIGFSVDWIDYTSGGSWQYSIDGGTWTNHGQTIANGNAYKRFYVNTPVTSNVSFRAYNGASATGICLVGITPYFASPASTQGLIVHNLGVNGTTLHSDVLATSGDRMAFYDSVVLGTGSPISNAPNAGVVMLHINDVSSPASVSTWGTDLTTFYNRVSPLGPVGFLCPWECGTGTTGVLQDSYRNDATNGTHAKGTALGAKVLDLFDKCKALGYGGGTLGTQQPILAANGFMISGDGTHPAQAGHLLLASWIYWFVRNQILSLGAVPSSYTVSAKQAAKQYSGKLAAVQYAAGAPVSI